MFWRLARRLVTEGPRTTKLRLEPARKAATLEIMNWDMARIHMIMGELPAHFSVPDSARRHLLKFGETLVSFEKASAFELAQLLHRVISACKKSNEALTYACVEHLLSLGADVNLNEYRDDRCVFEWTRPLDMAVLNNAVQVS